MPLSEKLSLYAYESVIIATQNGRAFFQFAKYCKRLKVRKSASLEVNLKTKEEKVGS